MHNCGYGMGGVKFQTQLKTFGVELPLEECKHIISVYRDTYECIPQLWVEGDEALEAMMAGQKARFGEHGALRVMGGGLDVPHITLPNGFNLQYPELNRYRNEKTGKREVAYETKRGRSVVMKSIWGGALTENVCQALARIIIGEQMLMIARRYKVAMTVHDSVVAVVPEDEADEARAFVEDCMRMRPKWATGLPLECESSIGASYGG